MEILFFTALAIVLGFAGSTLLNKLKLPGVVAYLLAGVLFGPCVAGVFDRGVVEQLSGFTGFALSIIAFIIGSQMELKTLKAMGRGIVVITLLESFGAFAVVAVGVYLLTGKLYLALILAGLAPASAPAGTVAVLQECKAKGRLTNALYAVVGIDDGLAIMIFAVAIGIAELSFTGNTTSVMNVIAGPAGEIIASVALGAVLGLATGFVCSKLSEDQSLLAVSLAGILLCAGIAAYFDLSFILSNLAVGMIFVNVFGVENKKCLRFIELISMPVYIVFFFLAGARLQLGLLPAIGLLGVVYIICRTIGLAGGAFLGGALAKQHPVIRNYLGFGILSQAGVAIGLAVLAGSRFTALSQQGQSVSAVIINTIAATTIFFEIIGPLGAKFAISRAGEIGVNITEEDLIKLYNVQKVMDTEPSVIPSAMPLKEVISLVSSTDSLFYPVTDSQNSLIGAVTLEGIRNTFTTQQINDWLVALDVMEPVTATASPQEALSKALERAEHSDTRYLPVVNHEGINVLVGLLDIDSVHRRLNAEVLEKHRKAGLTT